VLRLKHDWADPGTQDRGESKQIAALAKPLDSRNTVLNVNPCQILRLGRRSGPMSTFPWKFDDEQETKRNSLAGAPLSGQDLRP
jgi:hypothetical protein